LPLGVFLFGETYCGLFSASLILLVLAVAVFEFMALFGMYIYERVKKHLGPKPEHVPPKPAHPVSHGGLYHHREVPEPKPAAHKPAKAPAPKPKPAARKPAKAKARRK